MPIDLIPIEAIQHRILVLRGCKVLLDNDLAVLYGVSTKALNQAVKRNVERFPDDFMFQLTEEEKTEVVTNCDHLHNLKFSPVCPFAFTEHGALMAANVLRGAQAVRMSVFVVRAFVKLRAMLAPYKEIRARLDELEQTVAGHDDLLRNLIVTVRSLIELPKKQKLSIGFHASEGRVQYRAKTGTR
ncbi:MAG: ORF6N domain-containing protein [bacterium]|nr:ORF6N domain-containing protein [bacterium]